MFELRHDWDGWTRAERLMVTAFAVGLTLLAVAVVFE